jgi:hypothetical protein
VLKILLIRIPVFMLENSCARLFMGDTPSARAPAASAPTPRDQIQGSSDLT